MKTVVWMLVLAGLGAHLGCKVPPPKQAEEEPLSGEAAPSDPEEEASEEPVGDPIDEPPPDEEPADSSEPPPEKPAEAPPPKPTCAELEKAKCKITNGCAWNDVHKCVDE